MNRFPPDSSELNELGRSLHRHRISKLEERVDSVKFLGIGHPVVPTKDWEERARLRPVANITERVQQMIDETTQVAQMCDDYGWYGFSLPEHHCESEGLEQGFNFSLASHLIAHTKNIKIGAMGYVLPTHDPLRLAMETAWLDQISRGRTFAGFVRGYKTRWYTTFGQRHGMIPPDPDNPADAEAITREIYEETFDIIRKAWGDEPFSYDGKFYKVPWPKGGVAWAGAETTRRYGAPGELDDEGRIVKLNSTPKPYQQPHPKLFQGFSFNERTVKWAAQNSLAPIMLMSLPEIARSFAQAHFDECQRVGRTDVKELGNDTGVLRVVNVAATMEQAMEEADRGVIGAGFRNYWGAFGFGEVLRRPGEQGAVPLTAQRAYEQHFLIAGSPDDVKRRIETVQEACNPEYLVIWIDQGFIPLDDVKRTIELFSEKVMPSFVD